MVAYKIATLKHGGDRKSEQIKAPIGALIGETSQTKPAGSSSPRRFSEPQEAGAWQLPSRSAGA